MELAGKHPLGARRSRRRAHPDSLTLDRRRFLLCIAHRRPHRLWTNVRVALAAVQYKGPEAVRRSTFAAIIRAANYSARLLFAGGAAEQLDCLLAILDTELLDDSGDVRADTARLELKSLSDLAR